MNLRPFNQDDFSQVVSIQEKITRNSVSDNWKEMLRLHADNPCLPGFVALLEDQVVGFIIGEVKVGGFGSEISGWLEMVGVTPDQMGSGIGRALAQKLFEYFRKQGVSDVFTSVRWDSGDMLAYFKTQGFGQSPFINLQLRLKG